MGEREIREKLGKILECAKDHLEKVQACLSEADELMGGGVGVAAKMKAIEVTFSENWAERYKTSYVFNYAKDRAQMKRLLRTLKVEQLVSRIPNYIKSDDPFFIRNRHSFGLFVVNVNNFAGTNGDGESDEWFRPVGCNHKPPCKSDQEHTKRRTQEMRT